MVNELIKLKEQKVTLDKNIKKLESERNLLILKYRSDIIRILSYNLITCNVTINNNNRITLSFESNSFFNKTISIEPIFGEENIRFSINWDSGRYNTTSEDNSIKYVNAIQFVLNNLENKHNDFYLTVKNYFISLINKDKEIRLVYNEFQMIDSQVKSLELIIKKESFYKNLKDGNFYFTYKKPRYSSAYYHITHVEKVNAITSNVYYFKSTNIESVKFYIDNISDLRRRRVRNDELFSELSDHSIFTKDNFEDIITKHQIKINMIKIYKDLDIDVMKDMKKLCNTLFKFNAINKQIPDNNVLSIISEKRHHLLKYGHTE